MLNRQDHFLSWLSNNHENLSLEVQELDWIDNYFPGYFDICTSIEINGKISRGKGISDSQEHAVEKAVTEAIERAILSSIDKNTWNDELNINKSVQEDMTTSGFSLHIDEEEAILAASLELIERDLFFCHYLTKTPFMNCSDPDIKSSLFPKIVDTFARDGIELKLGQLFSGNGFSCHICVAFGDNLSNNRVFGTIIGTACARDAVSSINKAIFECIPCVITQMQSDDFKVYSLSEFSAIKSFSPVDHLYVGKNLDNVKYMRSLFQSSACAIAPGAEKWFFRDMIVKSIELPEWCKDNGLIAMRAYNPSLQKIYFGQTVPEKINFKRLEHFCRRPIEFPDIHSYPHPFP